MTRPLDIKRRAAGKTPVAPDIQHQENASGKLDERISELRTSKRLPASHKETKVRRVMNSAPAHSVSKRGRVGEGHPSLYTPELTSRLADHIAAGLTDEESAALEDISCDCIQRWRKGNPEFRVAIKKAEAQRLLLRLGRIEAGEPGWQGTAWALERIYPARFARPEVLNQIAVVKASAERVIVLPGEEFDVLIGRPGYQQRENGDLQRREGSLVYVIVRQQNNRELQINPPLQLGE